VGVLFIFSGLIKLNDPVGTKIKLEEYFEVFAADLPWAAGLFHALVPTALVLAVVLCAAEVVLGVALLLRYRLKTTLWILLGLIVFFTILTFYSAWFNRVTDCGCFGDAIKLTPWQSFGKDVLLLTLILVLISRRNRLSSTASPRAGLAVGVSAVACVLVGIYAIVFLPPFDLLPYKKGDNIAENMKLPPNAPTDEFEITYTLKNAASGEARQMTDKQYIATEIWKDTTWQIAETSEPKLVRRGVRPKITDFSVTTPKGEDVTQQVFAGRKLLVVMRDVRHATENELRAIGELIRGLQGKPVEVMLLTASDGNLFEEYRQEYQLTAPYYFTDNTVLKTMIRTDPGVLLLQNGTVVDKWPAASIPSAEAVGEK
jgi:uncharacterized membrane protein YphA (DoxX/SURF4 family)